MVSVIGVVCSDCVSFINVLQCSKIIVNLSSKCVSRPNTDSCVGSIILSAELNLTASVSLSGMTPVVKGSDGNLSSQS